MIIFFSILENIKDKSELFQAKLKYIKDEIDVRVEELTTQIIEIGNKLKNKFEYIEEEVLK